IRDLYVTGVQTCALPIWQDTFVAKYSSTGASRPLKRAGGTVFGHKGVLPAAGRVGQNDTAKIICAIEPAGHVKISRAVHGEADEIGRASCRERVYVAVAG